MYVYIIPTWIMVDGNSILIKRSVNATRQRPGHPFVSLVVNIFRFSMKSKKSKVTKMNIILKGGKQVFCY